MTKETARGDGPPPDVFAKMSDVMCAPVSGRTKLVCAKGLKQRRAVHYTMDDK